MCSPNWGERPRKNWIERAPAKTTRPNEFGRHSLRQFALCVLTLFTLHTELMADSHIRKFGSMGVMEFCGKLNPGDSQVEKAHQEGTAQRLSNRQAPSLLYFDSKLPT